MSIYETDFYGWTQETAEKLRQGKFNELDIEALIEEVETMGRSEKRELKNRLAVLLMHLLKWLFQPLKHSRSWQLTIKEQRRRANQVIKENPSLGPKLIEITEDAYLDAVGDALEETGLINNPFPATFEQTGWSIEQLLDEAFYPSEK